MNRRDFIKLTGVLVAAPTLLVLNKTASAAKNITSKLFGKDIIDYNRRWWCVMGKQRFTPITIEGKEYYIILLHPRQSYLLKVSVARDK